MEDFEIKKERNGRMIALMVIGGLVVIGGFLAFARWSTALANTPDINSARALYPNIVGTRIDSCSLCHTASIPSLNPYGAAYKAAGRNSAALTAIQSADSDGDGFTNIQEIASLTFPGDPNDHPVAATATSVPPTATSVPPTATSVPPTATKVPPTATNVPPTATNVPPTATSVPPTATKVPPTATGVPPTATGMPPTATVQPGAPGATPTMKPTRQPRATETDEPQHTPEAKPTRQPRPSRTPEPTEPEKHHATPTPGASKTPRATPTLGCRINDGGSTYGGRFNSAVQCTPVPGDDSNNIQPVRPNRTRQHSQADNFGISVSNSAGGYLDVPQW